MLLLLCNYPMRLVFDEDRWVALFEERSVCMTEFIMGWCHVRQHGRRDHTTPTAEKVRTNIC